MTEVSREKSFPLEPLSKDALLDASQVLAAALEQMDEIIAATNQEQELQCSNKDNSSFLHSNSDTEILNASVFWDVNEHDSNGISKRNSVNKILKNLTECIELMENTGGGFPITNELNVSSAQIVLKWLQKELKGMTSETQVPIQSEDISTYQKVHDLESEKKNLILQASVLADQVEVQAEKISELEKVLDRKKDELKRLEQNLHKEVLARSSVESSKLELMTELSNLRLRLTAAERDRKESDEKSRKLESELASFQARLHDRETEHSVLKGKLSQTRNKGISSNDKADVRLSEKGIDESNKPQQMDQEGSEIEALKSALDSSIASSNEEKSIVNERVAQKSQVYLSSSPNSTQIFQSLPPHSSARVSNTSTFHKSNSAENICPTVKVTAGDCQYDTMPRQTGSQVLQQLQVQFRDNKSASNTATLKSNSNDKDNSIFLKNNKGSGGSSGKSAGVSFGKGFFKLISGKRSSSDSYIADQECVAFPSTEKMHMDHVAPLTPPPYLIRAEKDKKGFMKFFSKWKKSGSQNIDRLEGELKRGGIRATAGPRLGWTLDMPKDPDLPFCNWNVDNIIEWLNRLGLSMYASECKRWMCNGDMLIKASGNDLEKELGIKNPLHKKKLILSVKSMNSALPNLPASINSMDYHWVVRWLDDIGLPQYKDSFTESRVDGRVLHYLTVEDLLYLKVNSQLHHFSIRRGIQVLRERGFDPHCLIRRSLPEESKTYTPELVTLWSNHRVMEWLRTVDLSEYAPNLRGSGVHGALIVYEPKFNTNLFATLLNIPPTKTLLRRHLATHFKHIVGDELTLLKREKETEAPLSPSIKIKSIRKNQFALKKKRNKNDFENEDYVCPMDIQVSSTSPRVSEGEKLIVRRNSDPSPQTQEQKLLDMQNTDEIREVSKDTTSFTTILPDENLNDAPTTVV